MHTTNTKCNGLMFSDDLLPAVRDGRKTQTRRSVSHGNSTSLGYTSKWAWDQLIWNHLVRKDRGPHLTAGNYEYLHVPAWNDSDGPTPKKLLDFKGNISEWFDAGGVTYRVRPRFEPGDRLYVREGVIKIGHERTGRNGQYLWPKIGPDFTEEQAREWFDKSCLYTADLKRNDPAWDEPHGRLNKMFMPRWAARTFIELTDVRVQRLQEISEEDSRAEGIERERAVFGAQHENGAPAMTIPFSLRGGFCCLWMDLYGDDSWDANPFVFVLTFKVV